MADFYTREACRLCNGKHLKAVLPLKESPLCDAYVPSPIDQKFYDLVVYLCGDCGFVQLNTIVNPEIIYSDYLYETTSSPGLSGHFENYAKDVCLALDKNSSKLTVDVGSNDGTLLGYFQANDHKVLGIEPAAHIANEASRRGIETLPLYFDEAHAANIVSNYGRAELITVNNLLANVDNLDNFVRGLDTLLDNNGVLVIESSYLLDMIDNMVFDFIYHEHLSYFSILPLIRFFKKFEMRLIRLQQVPTKGGSLRYFWARENSSWEVSPLVEQLIEKEQDAKISSREFKRFWVRIESARKELRTFLQTLGDKKLIAYGASATSTTLLSHFELSRYISCIVDDNPARQNLFSPGFHLPILSSDALYEQKPDYVLILAWRYFEQIKSRHKNFIDQGGRFIVPLPKLEVIRGPL